MITYADLEVLSDEALAHLYALGTPPQPPRPRAAPEWDTVRQMLLDVLISRCLEGRRDAPKQAGMLEHLRRRKMTVLKDVTSLSKWINRSREAVGLRGGYREAMHELVPEARRLSRNQERKVGRAKSA